MRHRNRQLCFVLFACSVLPLMLCSCTYRGGGTYLKIEARIASNRDDQELITRWKLRMPHDGMLLPRLGPVRTSGRLRIPDDTNTPRIVIPYRAKLCITNVASFNEIYTQFQRTNEVSIAHTVEYYEYEKDEKGRISKRTYQPIRSDWRLRKKGSIRYRNRSGRRYLTRFSATLEARMEDENGQQRIIHGDVSVLQTGHWEPVLPLPTD